MCFAGIFDQLYMRQSYGTTYDCKFVNKLWKSVKQQLIKERQVH